MKNFFAPITAQERLVKKQKFVTSETTFTMGRGGDVGSGVGSFITYCCSSR
jgi:hypothetical protein